MAKTQAKTQKIHNSMEKKELYLTPVVRIVDVRYEGSFMQSATGPIDDWEDDNDPINF